MKKSIPAFPKPMSGHLYGDGSSEIDPGQDGMSLRDYFAANAMQGILSCFREFQEVGNLPREERMKKRVDMAYEIADLMLKAREK